MKTLNFTLVFQPEPEGGYTVLVPSLPGCITYGKTLEEARAMASDAISGYLKSLRKHKNPIPDDNNALVSSIEIKTHIS